jgi:hypothetical protein
MKKVVYIYKPFKVTIYYDKTYLSSNMCFCSCLSFLSNKEKESKYLSKFWLQKQTFKNWNAEKQTL